MITEINGSGSSVHGDDRQPSATSEEFTLPACVAPQAKRSCGKSKSLNSVHVVVIEHNRAGDCQDFSAVVRAAGTTAGGNEYDGKNYYACACGRRARRSIPWVAMCTIAGNAGQVGLPTTGLDFSPALPSALVAGDVIEVHSVTFQTQAISTNDPADVW